MGTLDARTWCVEAEIIESDIASQKVTVRTSHQETFTDVPVSSPALRNKDKTGFHAFPRKGDRCWYIRDSDKGYVTSFGPAYDPSGKYVAARPALFRVGALGVHADLSGIDVLPSFTQVGGFRRFATEKLGLTVENLPASVGTPVSVSTTTALHERIFDGSAIARAVVPADGCSEALTTVTGTDRLPTIDSVDVGAILLDHSGGFTGDVAVTIKGHNFDRIIDISAAERTVLTASDGFPDTLITLQSAVYTNAPPYDGTVVVVVKRDLAGTPPTPDGVFDLILAHPTQGTAVRVVAGLSINSFTPGTSRKKYVTTPAGLSIGFAQQPTSFTEFGAFFGLRVNQPSLVLQELEAGSATADNSKYVGVSGGPFQDILALFDAANVQQDAGFLNSLRLNTLTLTEIDTTPPVLFFEITGVGADDAASAAIKARLTAAADQTVVFASENGNRNLGLELQNFQAGDKFRLELYTQNVTVPPDYSFPARIDPMDPPRITMPQTLFMAIRGENFRIGTSFTLVQTTRLVNIGTGGERLDPVTGTFPQIALGSDTSTKPRDLELFNPDGNTITGTSSLYRVSDKIVGLRFEVTGLTPGLYGEYNLVANHSGVVSSGTKVLLIRPNADANTGTQALNAYLQKVREQDASGVVTDLFQYGVDDTGRLDISAKGGVFFDGKPAALTSSLVGRISTGTGASASLVADTGDGALVTLNGNILIAALRASPTDETRGDVRIHADACVTIGQGCPTVIVGRRAAKAQFGTLSPVVHVGGSAKKMETKFPTAWKDITTTPDNVKDLLALGPALLLAEDQTFPDQVLMEAGSAPKGLGSTYFALRSRAHSDGKYIEGRINLVFVPNGAGVGTEDDPFTGTWHIPLA